MGKYDPLAQYLRNHPENTLTLSFLELEQILGFSLPSSAYTYRQWWQNGGHSQSDAWMHSGFLVDTVSFSRKTVTFCRKGAPIPKPAPISKVPSSTPRKQSVPLSFAGPVFQVCGYPFRFLQQLIPETEKGFVKEYYPQANYQNTENLPLLRYGAGAFCHFSIQAPPIAGVYLWVDRGQIIYIGETANLEKRFNMGYGNISPRNCFSGGQSTNCKMNKVVMESYRQGHPIDLYFYPTDAYKQVELDLLRKIKTKYNVKDN